MIKIENLGLYETRGKEIVEVIEIDPDRYIYVVFVNVENGMRYTTTDHGHRHHDGPAGVDDLLKYLPKEKYPELYLW